MLAFGSMPPCFAMLSLAGYQLASPCVGLFPLLRLTNAQMLVIFSVNVKVTECNMTWQYFQ